MKTYMGLMKSYADKNPERFNQNFIMSKNDDEILPELTNIFKSLEIIKEIHIEDVSINYHEEFYGPIKQQGHYYKSPLESRLLKVHYKVKIDGRDEIVEKDMFLPKMMDHTFYINEGVRFYPIWQVVDNMSYPTNNGVSLKSLMMPITLIQNDPIDVYPEFGKPCVEKIPNYHALIFGKKVSPLYYIMLKYSLASLEAAGISPFEETSKYQSYQDEDLITKFCEYTGIDIKFNDNALDLVEDGRTVFTIKEKKQTGTSFSIKDEDMQTEMGQVVLGMLLSTRTKDKKCKLVFSRDELITPWFWLDSLIEASGFSRSTDPFKRYDKVRGVSISLNRIIDDQVRKILPVPKEAKEDIYSILKYLLVNFKTLFAADPQDLHTKRLRLYEYILYPLRVYFSQHINRMINQQTNLDVKSIEKVFTSLTPMFIIKNLVTSQLLRTYNATNEFNLFNALLKGTTKGPQALGKGVGYEQRDIHPSYVGRIGLVAASAGDPGVSFSLSPFVQVYDGYFDKSEAEKAKD